MSVDSNIAENPTSSETPPGHQQPHSQITPQRIRAEVMLTGERRSKAGTQVDVERVVGQSIGPNGARQHEQGDHRDPDERQMMSHEAIDRAAVPPAGRSCVGYDGGHIC
ncbi:hypothetical protein ACVJMY_004709 [Bradyrhizobium diazoefficiens]